MSSNDTARDGSARMAHVISQTSWRLLQSQPKPSLVGFDPGTALLLTLTQNTVDAYSTFSDVVSQGQGAPSPQWSYQLSTPAPVLSLSCSPDGAILAVQRSKVLIELIHLQSGNTFVHGTHKGRNAIKGFFFATTSMCDLIIVTAEGLELSQYCKYRHGLRICSQIKVPVSWYQYSHTARLLLLGSGEDTSQLHAWQMCAEEGLVKLPSLQLNMLLNPSGGVLDLRDPWQLLAQMGSRADPRDIKILKLYGSAFCAYIHREKCQLLLYRLYRDAVLHHLTYALFSPHVELSTIDNIIVVHHVRSGEAALLDIRADTDAPLLAPLPLHFVPPEHTPPPTASDIEPSSFPPGTTGRGSAEPVSPAAVSASTSATTNSAAGPSTAASALPPPPPQHSALWQYIFPNIILDPEQCVLYRLHLDLEATAQQCADPALLAGVLSRRRLQPCPVGALPPKALLLATLRKAMQDELPPPVLSNMFEQLSRSYADAVADQHSASVAATTIANGTSTAAAGSQGNGVTTLPPSTQVVTPQEVAREVFQWAREECGLAPLYLLAAVSEYQNAMSACPVALPAYLHLLPVDIWLQQGQHHQVLLMLWHQPTVAAALLADEMADLARASQLPQSLSTILYLNARAAIHNLFQQHRQYAKGKAKGKGKRVFDATALEQHALLLLQNGKVLKASRWARNHGLVKLQPALFLDTAAGQGEAVFMAVYRLWAEALKPVFGDYQSAKEYFFHQAGGQA